ncbi:MurR/RpiR family transcriptional regulator [Gorillibacterium timonense]|uniref:MurR/RpiR family transcriptional regulator n=1 Tax=Gorillibacterium timonense TaxID=1689269 RepID=UPI00071C442B|nr:MurR/RpiR family transcriptional regulator [Gorillibacterium timonense]
MNLLNAIREKEAALNPKERAIASFVLTHPQETVQMTITELAERSGGSTATISRFCRLFLAGGFSEFKLRLSTDLVQAPPPQSYQDIVAGNSLDRIASAMEANLLSSITDTTRSLDMREMQRAVEALNQARQIDLYGVATSGVVAQDFYQKLIRIGKRAVMFADSHMQLTSASALTNEDVAIAISYSGETPETVKALRSAAESGATVISLTKFGPNTLASLAAIRLYTSNREAGLRRGDMASRIAQLHVLDILFTAMISSNFDEYVPRLEKSFQVVKTYTGKEER